MADHNNKNEGSALDITDQPTGEYPALTEGELPTVTPTELNGTSHAAPTDKDDSVKAAFWLSHLETEVNRLHSKWQTIDAEFKSREARIAELHAQVAKREATIAKLSADLQCETAALKATDDSLASKDGEIAALTEDRRTRDERIAALATELADAEVAHQATRDEVDRARAEATRLSESLRQEQAAIAAGAQRHAEMLAEQHALQVKLQDLETYIDGRHDSWAAQNAKLADYKDALLGLEKTVKARDAVIAQHEQDKRQLAARILDLERQCSELVGRRKEREEAYDELQRKLAVHFETTEQLKAEHAARTKEMEQAVKQAADSARHIESLERGIERREETLTALSADLEQNQSAVAELTTANDKLTTRVDELEKGLEDRAAQLQTLRSDLRMSHDQLRLAQQQLSDRTTQLASSQEAVDQKSRQIERLVNDLESLRQEAAKLRTDLETVEARAAELGTLRQDAMAEAKHLKTELAAQRNLVASLEAEVRSKQATEDLLERSVGRITDLGASLAALDKQMTAGPDNDEPVAQPSDESLLLPVDKSSVHHADFVATLAADERLEAAAESAANEDMLPMDLLLDDSPNEIVDVGDRTHIEGPRKLVITLGGEAIDYPIVKNIMTIGRGHESDIRIASHFVSRIHAKVSTKGIATIIEDAGSKNGILVNSERVKRRVLRHGDVVNIGGELNLRFVDALH